MQIAREVTWILEGRTPEQVPMARLAEYMQHLAAMFGETESVHFERIERGSTRLVAAVTSGIAAQKVQSRVYAVRNRVATIHAMGAYSRINEMVGQDSGSARLTFGSGIILRFPGKNVERNRNLFTDYGSVDGRVYALLEQQSGDITARLRPRDGDNYIPCTAKFPLDRALKEYLFEPVRVFGKGKWERGEDGQWVCHSLRISEIERITNSSLRDAINALRAIEAPWPDDPLGDLVSLNEEDEAA